MGPLLVPWLRPLPAKVALFLTGPNIAFVDQIEFIELIPLRHTPILPVLLELMKMRIRPAHDHLECAVEATQFDCEFPASLRDCG